MQKEKRKGEGKASPRVLERPTVIGLSSDNVRPRKSHGRTQTTCSVAKV